MAIQQVLRTTAGIVAAVLAAGGLATPAHAAAALDGRVTTTVVDRATGQPVAGACVELAAPGRGGLSGNCADYSDERGRVTSGQVPSGLYQMFVYAPDGFGHQWAGLTGGTGDQREASLIHVWPGLTSQAATVRLDPAGALTGQVRDPDGTPVPQANVAITAWGYGVGPALGSTTTDDDGRYRLDALGPYSWPVLVTDAPGAPRQWTPGVGDRFRGERVRVAAGQDKAYDIVLVRGGLLRGSVTVRGGSAVDGWRLTAENTVTGDQIGVADSADGGDWMYEMPLAGPQTVRIKWIVWSGGQSRSGHWWAPVTVAASGTRTVNLTIG